jgi:glyoxylase I family protein
MVEVTGIDHIYITVSDLTVSEQFYDRALVEALGFRKNSFTLGDEPHIQYACRHFGFVLRPVRVASKHEPYSPGLHHFCMRVDTAEEVEATASKLYPEYAEDYAATFFEDPDGIRLEVTNYRNERRERHDSWPRKAE